MQLVGTITLPVGGGGIPTIDNQGREFPCGRLFILL